jgi:hypothetical protein
MPDIFDTDSGSVYREIAFPFKKDFPKIQAHPYLHDPKIRLNKHKYRSDDFTTEHAGLHILFAGCSNTFGDGLEEHEIWAKRLYDKIHHKENTSGFFNIGAPGLGILAIVFNIYKYIESFGKPNVIFINFPVSRRFLSFDTTIQKHIYVNIHEPEEISEELWHTIPLIEYQYIFMLERYCKSNNINLIYGTWAPRSNFNHYQDLNCYVNILDDDMVAKYVIENPDDEYAMNARDGNHYGNGYHTVWAEIMYNRYMEKSSK